MATTRKRSRSAREASPSETPIQNNEQDFVQREEIGYIKSRLDDQEKTDERIEKSIQQLVENHEKQRENTTRDFTELRCEITKLGTLLQSASQTSDQMMQNQTEMLKQINNISISSTALENSQNTIKDLLHSHMNESGAWREKIERRVGRLERVKYFWYTLIGLAVTLVSVLSYLAAIYDVFGKGK